MGFSWNFFRRTTWQQSASISNHSFHTSSIVSYPRPTARAWSPRGVEGEGAHEDALSTSISNAEEAENNHKSMELSQPREHATSSEEAPYSHPRQCTNRSASHVFSPLKEATMTTPFYAPEFYEFYSKHKGSDSNRRIEGYTSRQISRASQVAIGAKIRAIRKAKSEAPIYKPLCAILNRACLDLAAPKDKEVLVFVEASEEALRVMPDTNTGKPDLAGFFVRRDFAERIVSGVLKRPHADWPDVPPAQQLISLAECKALTDADKQCKRYLLALSRHRPGSSMQYGFVANRHMIRLIGLGLDDQQIWPKVEWTDSHCIEKLYGLLKLVLDEAKKPMPPSVPKLYRVLYWKNHTFGVYTTSISDRRFLLLHIFSGRGDGRKTFVALGAEEGRQEGVRMLKYSWPKPGQRNRERLILEKLADTPGIVRIDSNLSRDSVDTDEATGQERNLLVLKTIGSSLCSCQSVQAFLEAMYDLLEVLRYSVQEKKILHRDISWGNVLVNPRQSIGRKARATGEGPPGPVKIDRKGEIHHTYRFVHELLGEDSVRHRVALTDFDHAVDLEEDPSKNLEDATGTPMFMAEDVIAPRGNNIVTLFSPFSLKRVQHEALGVHDKKYADDIERGAWDEFYGKELPRLEYGARTLRSFRHGAVHDAESVFWLCVLFFCRMLPKGIDMSQEDLETMKVERGKLFKMLRRKTVGDDQSLISRGINFFHVGNFDDNILSIYESLSTIKDYLWIPWYTVPGTGRGERFEFHLHDFMQRLLWKHIVRLRDSNDPIPIQPDPLPVKIDIEATSDASTSCLRNLSSARPIKSDDKGYDKSNSRDLDLADPRSGTIMIDDPEEFLKMHKDFFLREHWDVHCWKRRERLCGPFFGSRNWVDKTKVAIPDSYSETFDLIC